MARHGRCPLSYWLRFSFCGIWAGGINCLGLLLVAHAHGLPTERLGTVFKELYPAIEHIDLDQLDAVIEVRVHKESYVLLTIRSTSTYQPITVSAHYEIEEGRKVLRLSSVPASVPLSHGTHPHAPQPRINLSVPAQTSVQATLIGLAHLHTADTLEGCLELTLLGSSRASFFGIKALYTGLTVHGEGVVACTFHNRWPP